MDLNQKAEDKEEKGTEKFKCFGVYFPQAGNNTKLMFEGPSSYTKCGTSVTDQPGKSNSETESVNCMDLPDVAKDYNLMKSNDDDLYEGAGCYDRQDECLSYVHISDISEKGDCREKRFVGNVSSALTLEIPQPHPAPSTTYVPQASSPESHVSLPHPETARPSTPVPLTSPSRSKSSYISYRKAIENPKRSTVAAGIVPVANAEMTSPRLVTKYRPELTTSLTNKSVPQSVKSAPSTSALPPNVPPPPPPPPPLPRYNRLGLRDMGQVVRPKLRVERPAAAPQPGPSGAGSSTVNYINAIHRPSDLDQGHYFETLVARRELRSMLDRIGVYFPVPNRDPNDMSLDELQAALENYRFIDEEILYANDSVQDLFDINFDLQSLRLEEGLDVPQPSFAKGNEVKTECQICFDDVKLHKRICCSFAACDSCIIQYIETSVNQGVVKIECIGGECDSFIYRDEILARLSVPMKEKYYRFLVDANKDPNVKTCPRCSNIHSVGTDDKQKQTKFGLPVVCPECRLDWCFECQAPWHAGVKCKDFKRGDKLVKSWAKEQHFGCNNAQKCPKCKIFIERKGGCDHMTCSKCETSFCYKCGARYIDLKFFGNHMSRYSPFGCKYSYKADSPVLRRFVRGSVFGAKLLGGLVLVGLGIAAVGVLIGTSVVILPAFGGYKYHKHRKFKRRLKRQQELIKARSRNAILELQRDRPNIVVTRTPRDREMLWETLMLEDTSLRRTHEVHLGEPVHIGIQTGRSQQVDVTVHNPYQQDSVASNEGHSSEIRMNITDDQGSVTVTTAEISHNPNSGDGTEAEVVLHVKTTYPKGGKGKKEIDKPKETLFVRKNSNQEVLHQGSGKSEGDSAKPDQSETGMSAPSNNSDMTDNNSKYVQSHRRSLSAGTVRKNVKKQEFGSISRKWCGKTNAVKIGVDGEPVSDFPSLNPCPVGSLHDADGNKPSGDHDEDAESDILPQSGCFIKLFGKKLNTLQGQSEKDKQVNKTVGGLLNCPDVVSCALEAEMKMKDNLEKEGQEVKDIHVKVIEKDEYLGLISEESSITAL